LTNLKIKKNMIETTCSNCGNKRVFDESYSGRKFKCPNCGEVVEIKHAEPEDILYEPMDDDVELTQQESTEAMPVSSQRGETIKERREREDVEINEMMEELKAKTISTFKIQKVLIKIASYLYLANIIYFIYSLDHCETSQEEFLSGLSIVVIIVFFIPLLLWRLTYSENKEKIFGKSKDYEFDEIWLNLQKNKIISDNFFERYEEDDEDLDKLGEELKKIMYKLDHPNG